jgi:anti-sigma B factor antagonist
MLYQGIRANGVDRRLRVSGIRRDDGSIRVRVTGDLDAAELPAFQKRVATLLSAPVRCIELDLVGVTFLDAAGARELLALRRRETQQGTEVVLVAASRAVRQVLGLFGAGDWLPG